MIAAILSTISGTNEPERLFGWLNVVSGFIAGSRTLRIIEMDRAPNVKLWVEVDAGGDAVQGAVAYESLVDAIRRAANGKSDYGWARKVVEEASA